MNILQKIKLIKMIKKTFKIFVVLGLIGALLATIFGFFVVRTYSENLPDYEELKNYNPIITSRLYGSDGSLISEFAKEKRIFVPIENIPNHVVKAFLAAEDANFYNHSGIDPLAIIRASIRNLASAAKGEGVVGGASTITQQVVKNLLLTKERTYKRKIKEAILAIRMSKTFEKDKILELYLNQIYLGSGAYGVAAAAQVYFGKSIDELTLEEDALLATLPKAPSKLDPRKNIEKAKARRDWVINRMIEEGFIEEKEGLDAMAKPIILQDELDLADVKASFFSDSVKKELSGLYGSDSVFENGYTISTTLDSRLQMAAIKAFEKGIEDYDQKHGYRGAFGKISTENWLEKLKKFEIKELYKKSWKKAVVLEVGEKLAKIGIENGKVGVINLDSIKWAAKYIEIDYKGKTPENASDVFNVGDVILAERSNQEGIYFLRQIPAVNGGFVVLDPHSGRVLAMSGGYVDAPNQFNRAIQAMRQPGSTMKTFAYIAALENNMTPATIIMDEEVSLNQGFDLPPYNPSNYSGNFYGPTTLRKGLEKSYNVTTVRMADQIGLDKVVEVVRRFGINDNPKTIYSLPLGSTETSVMRLACAYAMMINGGKRIVPAMIEKIQDRDGTTIYKRDKRRCENCVITNEEILAQEKLPNLELPILMENRESITDSATAYQITSMLQGVVERGTAAKAKEVGKIIGGKTGTTNNSFDSWFVGFSPDLVMAVYVGFDIPKSLGSYETGASISLPIFIDFMKEALKNTPSTPFRVPSSVKLVKIDYETGKIPTLETPKNRIFFEAFKLDRNLDFLSKENNENSNQTNQNSEENDGEDFFNNDDSPSGIY